MPCKLVKKITDGEFVEMADLLLDKLASSEDNELTKSLKKRRIVTDIIEWVRCFGLYISIISQSAPERVSDLLGYQALIIDAYTEYQGLYWPGYDRQFRLRAAVTPVTSWSTVETALWNRAFSGLPSTPRCIHCFFLASRLTIVSLDLVMVNSVRVLLLCAWLCLVGRSQEGRFLCEDYIAPIQQTVNFVGCLHLLQVNTNIIIDTCNYMAPFIDKRGHPHHLCLAAYHIPAGFKAEVKPHGNAKKSSAPFYPTWASTMQMVKQESQKSGPKDVVASVSVKVGGMLGALAPGQLPRGEEQVSHAKCTIKFQENQADELFIMMQRSKCGDEFI